MGEQARRMRLGGSGNSRKSKGQAVEAQEDRGMAERKPKRNPDRIDFKVRPDGNIVIQKFWRIKGRYKCLSHEVKETKGGWSFNFPAVLDWLREHGYEVIEWGGTRVADYPVLWPGARAFKHEMKPIRTRWEIYQFRQKVQAEVRRFLSQFPEAATPMWGFHDLAYYL